MTMVDSVDKIVKAYFKGVSRQAFIYKGKTYNPGNLSVSPLICRGYTCPAKCGACCPRFSLDYLPSELPRVLAGDKLPRARKRLVNRLIMFNGKLVLIYTDAQDDHERHHCRHLNMKDARCGIHADRPFSCDFELIRFLHYDTADSLPNKATLTQKLFGYGWKMTRIDGGQGAMCDMTPPSPETVADVVRKLDRLKQWTDHFGLKTCIPAIRTWVQSNPTTPLFIPYNSTEPEQEQPHRSVLDM